MAKNIYFPEKVRSEHELYENLVIESLKIYGNEVYYLPRDLVNEDTIFGDDPVSSFNSSYKIEMYIDNIEGFDGEGDLFTRFGVEIRDEATFVVSRRRWSQIIERYDNDITGERPREGDLIYFPLTNKLFQINHVEHEQPFYQIGNINTYKMRCQLFEYTGEDLDTGIDEIDEVQNDYSYTYLVTTDSSSVQDPTNQNWQALQTLSDGTIVSGEVLAYSDSDNIWHIGNVGADDGKYHSFTTGTLVLRSGRVDYRGDYIDSSFTITAVTEQNNVAQNEQNDDFSDFGDDFLDFTETNPFGEPS